MGSSIGLMVEDSWSCGCPYHTYGDTKIFGRFLVLGHIRGSKGVPDIIGAIGSRFNVDLQPLEKVFDPNSSEFPADWEATAQPPAELGRCLGALVKALTDNPDALTEIGASYPLRTVDSVSPLRTERTQDYFLDGYFLRDLMDLLRIVEWVENADKEHVRLYYG